MSLTNKLEASLRSRIPIVCASVVVFISGLVVLGWAFEITTFKSILPGYITMKANTALCFMLLAGALLLLKNEDHSKPRIYFGLTLVAVVATVSVLTLLQYLLGTNFGIDELIFSDPDGISGRFPPGRLAPITAVNFILLALGFVLRYVPRVPKYRSSQFLLGLAFIASFQGLVGYGIGLTYLFGSAFYTQMAIHTTVCFMVLCIGILSSQMNQGYVRAFTSDLPSSAMARKMLLAIILSPILVRWLATQGETLGYYDQDFSNLIQVIGIMVIMGLILIRSTCALHQTELEREVARDKAEAANRAKTNFLANISHELRTPLGAVLGFSELLATEPSSMSERDSLQAAIKRNGDQLIRLIDDLLDISKFEGGELTIEKAKFPLQEFLSDLTSLARLKADQRNIKFTVEYLTALPEVVETDAARLRQVLLNVIANAVKFNTQGGEVVFQVSFDPLLQPRVRFTIKDTGTGISSEAAAELFEPFTQADASLTRKYGGTGVGLALSRKIARALGGNLRLMESKLGEGATFSIDIDPGPLSGIKLVGFYSADSRDTTSNDKPTLSVHDKIPVPTGLLKDRCILLVEDSPDNQALISRFLLSAGAKVEVANDGLEGVDKALHGKFDIVLMDLQMPNLDGYDAVKRLHGIGYKVPIIALTAHALREDRERCLKGGFVEHLTKPVNKRQLLHTIESVGSSRVDLQACKLEYSIVSPK